MPRNPKTMLVRVTALGTMCFARTGFHATHSGSRFKEPFFVKIALVYPPTCDPTAPYLAVPMLAGFLRANGIEVLPVDANVEAYDALLRPAPLAGLRDRVETRLRHLDGKATLDHASQRAYLQLWKARGDAATAPDGIAEARATLKDTQAFFDADRYEQAVETIESALRLISAAHAPLDLTFSGYRTPF